MQEGELIKKSAEGNQGAFEQLIAPYMQSVVNHAYMMLGDKEDACDMAQEAFVKAFVSVKSFGGQSSFKTWLFKIATNVCLDFLRKKKRRPNVLSLTIEGEDTNAVMSDVADTQFSPDTILESNELKDAIIKAINSLDAEYRAAIVLRELEGMDYKSISKVLGVSLGTVKSRINRARLQLREKLLEYKELF
ncbi:MAG: sigma-70 family RNA polymerase sigma factor [Ruminococcaceae bacterium]|nr:sigma-70 family RNA polymerase sigma factor [Oscillospiraceae bacterium]